MIHTANEYVSKHHRYLLSGVTIGLKSLDGKTGSAEDSDKGIHIPSYMPLTLTSYNSIRDTVADMLRYRCISAIAL